MIRWTTIRSWEKTKKEIYTFPIEKEWEESLTDRSHWVPTKEGIRGLSGSGAQIDTSGYDYPDGRDRGESHSIRARKRDIAETYQQTEALKNQFKENIKADRDEKALQNKIAEIQAQKDERRN